MAVTNRRTPTKSGDDWLYKRIEELERQVNQIANRAYPTIPVYDYTDLPLDPIEGQVAILTNAPAGSLTGGGIVVDGGTPGTVLTTIKFRLGSAAAWTSANPTLANGEPGYETDTHKVKVGDGTIAWASLPYVTGAAHRTTHVTGGTDAFTVADLLDAIARVGVRKNSTGSTFNRRRINLIEGANTTITVNDDSVGEEVDVTIASAGSGASNVATDAIWDAAGDQAVGTGADTAAKVGIGTNGQVWTVDTTLASKTKWATPSAGGSTVLDEATAASTVSITSTAEGTGGGTLIIATNAITYDGSTKIVIEFFAPYISIASSTLQNVLLNLYEGTTDITRLANWQWGSASAFLAPFVVRSEPFTPSAAAHTYSIRGWKTASGVTASVGMDTGVATHYNHGSIRVIKA